MIRLGLLLLWAGCYPVCATDADCDNGYCQIDKTPDGDERKCIACDPVDRPCLDGKICAGFNMCVPCQSDDECGEGLSCTDGACVEIQMMSSDDAMPSDDGGV